MFCGICTSAQDVVVPPRTCVVCKETKPTSNFSGDSKTCKACVNKAADKKKRKERENAEKERIAREKAEKEKEAREHAEKERLAREKAEQERLAREKAEQERLAREEAEREDREGVDLGLPSGTLWATRNVGASSPEDYGDYFAWGETRGYKTGKRIFYWNSYEWCNDDEAKLTKYCNNSKKGNKHFIDKKTELDLEDDAAYVNWGREWRIPTIEQIQELKEKCSWSWTTYKGVKGYLVRGKSGKSIFFPAAGWRDISSFVDIHSYGYYWSRSLLTFSIYTNSFDPRFSHFLFLASNEVSEGNMYRYGGLSIRPVRMKRI